MSDPVSDQHAIQYLAQLGAEHRRQAEIEARTSEAYKAARVDRLNRDWQPDHRSGDAAIRESWSLLTSRIRDSVRNTSIFKRARQVLVDLIVGPGTMTFSSPLPASYDLEADLDLEFAFESDDEFERWATDEADVEGKLSLYDMERLAFGEMVETGDCLILTCQSDDRRRRVPLCYQLIEREQLDASKDRPRTETENQIVHGIEIDRVGRPVAYHIYDAHPYDAHMASPRAGQSTPIPAERIQHLYVPMRPSAHIGISWFHAITQPARDRDWYLGNELTAAAIGALLSVIVPSEDGGSGLGFEDGLQNEDAHGNELVRLGRGLLFHKKPLGDDPKIIESNRPNRDAAPFLEMIDHDVANGVNVSHCRLTSRYKATSYTAARAAHLDDDAHVRPLQGFLGRRLALPIRRRHNAQAAALGLYQTKTPREFEREQQRLQRFDVLGAGREQLDPEKETEASLSKLRGGLSTLKIECGKRQLHYLRVLRQMAQEKRLAERLGVVLDFSKGQGGERTKSSTSAGDESETEEAAEA